MTCCAYAKALHYKEEQFHKNPSSEVLETLISINNKLQNKEAAAGKKLELLFFLMRPRKKSIHIQLCLNLQDCWSTL